MNKKTLNAWKKHRKKQAKLKAKRKANRALAKQPQA
jgi:GH24 family phage-related lysozyme (muramidase)